jgi:hypothetical protein
MVVVKVGSGGERIRLRRAGRGRISSRSTPSSRKVLTWEGERERRGGGRWTPADRVILSPDRRIGGGVVPDDLEEMNIECWAESGEFRAVREEGRTWTRL